MNDGSGTMRSNATWRMRDAWSAAGTERAGDAVYDAISSSTAGDQLGPTGSNVGSVERVIAAPLAGTALLEDWLVAWALARLTAGGVRSIVVDGGSVSVDAVTRRAALALVEKTVSGICRATDVDAVEVWGAVAGAGRVLLLRIDVRLGGSGSPLSSGDLSRVVGSTALFGAAVRGDSRLGGARLELALLCERGALDVRPEDFAAEWRPADPARPSPGGPRP